MSQDNTFGVDTHPVVEPGNERCDFCNAPRVVWRFHVFPLPIELGTEGHTVHMTNSDWAACPECAALIRTNDREALLRRSVRSLGDVDAGGRIALRGLHEAFFGVKNGPGCSTI